MNASTAITFRTIKAAEAAGFHRLNDYEYGGEQITVKGVPLGRHTQFASSATAWRGCGRKVISGSVPHAIRTCRVGGGSGKKSVTYAVYRLDQTVLVQKRTQPRPLVAYPLTPENVLAAIFSINRSAKRFRDAAQSSYLQGMHGFAKMHRKRKEMLYALKDNGIVHAYRAGFVAADCLHGTLTVYRGGGYCFHSPLRPDDTTFESNSDELVFIESKPRKVSEMRLRDAIATLEQFPSDLDGFSRHGVPTHRPTHGENEWYEDAEDDDWDDEPEF